MSSSTEILPRNAEEFQRHHGQWLRLLQPKGFCLVPGKIYGETAKQYRVAVLVDDTVLTRRYAKSDLAHVEPCKYCPPSRLG